MTASRLGTTFALHARVTAPRIVVPGATVAVTRRCTFRKAFLSPWHADVPRNWLFALAHAQLRTDVAVHLGQCVVSHHHLDVTPERDNFPEFLQLLHHDISSALNVLLARERYDRPGELFDKRSTHVMRCLDAAAQATSLNYTFLN